MSLYFFILFGICIYRSRFGPQKQFALLATRLICAGYVFKLIPVGALVALSDLFVLAGTLTAVAMLGTHAWWAMTQR